ncbi:MAG TPA: hypothetical protein VGJ70_03755 [Solirubrobacteraceae bacterium]
MSGMRSFDPRSVGRLECRAWETYYLRRWGTFLLASVGMVRAAFGMSWPRTLLGAWLVLRANQKWAPFPDNDPAAARALMTRFYRLLAASDDATFDPARAARLDVEWWRAHRDAQDGRPGGKAELVGALRDLYVHVYSADPADVLQAAQLRADAMDLSDRWVAAGRVEDDPLLAQERALLVRSYASLLAAVHR